MTTKEILIDEIDENAHPSSVEHVILWALEHYAKTGPEGKFGTIIARYIADRIKEEATDY